MFMVLLTSIIKVIEYTSIVSTNLIYTQEDD